ncbi:ParB/RepB/Spo0J family partition protein [Mesobacterium pallidum]|uniref:ParB/RepB/Spo0J family partition protein n=1 Tax=Mesobacterium pallidum TaxID=2872037 RepID=UPI001EE372C5|nr:ParB/RepB/Spo0J family partition protein [Mesobacterium pallidum]
MNDRTKTRGLGRGLSALMADVGPVEQQGEARRAEAMVPVEKIFPNPDQPRRTFTPDQLDDLANSIRTKGVIQPLIVRARPEQPGTYEIVAGERRWRAAQLAQLHELPVLVRNFTDTEVLEVAIIENIQRENLNPIEEAAGYRQLMDRFGHTQEKMAEALGKSRSHIANLLRLLNLPGEVIEMVRDGDLTAGHARTLITSENPVGLAQQIVSRGLSVREAEKLAKGPVAPKPAAPRPPKSEKDADTRAIEGDLSATLKMKVSIDHKPGTEGGTVTITYQTLEELDDLCRMLSGG